MALYFSFLIIQIWKTLENEQNKKITSTKFQFYLQF